MNLHYWRLAALGIAFLLASVASAAVAAPPPILTKPPPKNQPIPPPGNAAINAARIPGTSRLGDLTVNFAEWDGNLKTGDFVIPGQISGNSSDGNFRGDRAFGNQKREEITLVGHVVVHRLGGFGKRGSPQEPVTLTCDQLRIANKAKVYTASGNVRIMQGNKTLTAPLVTLDDMTHIGRLSGGVHAEQPPDRSFDAAEVLYNTQSEDFKALGGVRATFPISHATPAPPTGAPVLPLLSPKPAPTPSK